MPEPMPLGACLYVPATHPGLAAIAAGQRLPRVRTIVFCSEDSVTEDDLPSALRNLESALPAINQGEGNRVFVRARSPQVMRTVLAMPDVERIAGFVLPKVTLASLPQYLALLPSQMLVMPTLETKEVFDDGQMRRLLRLMDHHQARSRIHALRIGGNDLLALLRIRRPRGKTLYETPIGHVIARLATTFIPEGYSLSAPVFEYLDDPQTLDREISIDLDHGLSGKTAIHPDQVPLIEAHYRISDQDISLATQILADGAPGVFAARGAMCEPATHRSWARTVLGAAREFGGKDALAGVR